MQTVTWEGRTFQYDVIWNSTEYGVTVKTVFYDGTRNVKKYRMNWRKFKIEDYMKEVPKEVFRVYADANSTEITKEWWQNELSKQISLLNRAHEIANNQLV